MKAAIVFTGTGPILILTTYESLTSPEFAAKLASKGIRKYIVSELPFETVKQRYGTHFSIVMGDLHQTDDLRVLDYDGHHVFRAFSFSEMGAPQFYEAEESRPASEAA